MGGRLHTSKNCLLQCGHERCEYIARRALSRAGPSNGIVHHQLKAYVPESRLLEHESQRRPARIQEKTSELCLPILRSLWSFFSRTGIDRGISGALEFGCVQGYLGSFSLGTPPNPMGVERQPGKLSEGSLLGNYFHLPH